MNPQWQQIETAPRDGTVVEITDGSTTVAMGWNPKREQWEGIAFAPMRKVGVCWDKESPQPTHWKAI